MHESIDFAALVERLQRQGKTQAQIATLIGVDQATVSRVRAGKLTGLRAIPAIKLIKAVGGVVNVPALEN